MRYKLSPLAYINKIQDKYIIGFGTKQNIIDKNSFLKITNLLKNIDKYENIDEFIDSGNSDYDTLRYCIDNKLILEDKYSETIPCDTYNYKNFLYLYTYFDDPNKIIKSINKTNFVFIGCGGIGTHMAYSLSSYNPKGIYLIDNDKVSITNLNRQFLFEQDDIGKYKTNVIKSKLEKRFNNCAKIVSIPKEFHFKDFENQFKKEDNIFLIVSGDSSYIVKDATLLSKKLKSPSLNVGYLNDISCIGPFYIPGKTLCPFCDEIGAKYNYEFESEVKFINKNYESPASYPNCSIASSMALVDLFHYFNNEIDKINSINKRIGISNFDFKKIELNISKKGRCEICDK